MSNIELIKNILLNYESYTHPSQIITEVIYLVIIEKDGIAVLRAKNNINEVCLVFIKGNISIYIYILTKNLDIVGNI
jgi:hypothetical protein